MKELPYFVTHAEDAGHMQSDGNRYRLVGRDTDTEPT